MKMRVLLLGPHPERGVLGHLLRILTQRRHYLRFVRPGGGLDRLGPRRRAAHEAIGEHTIAVAPSEKRSPMRLTAISSPYAWSGVC